MGALPTLYAATEPGLAGGTYVGPDGFAEQRGHPEAGVAQQGGARRAGGAPAVGGVRGDDRRALRAGRRARPRSVRAMKLATALAALVLLAAPAAAQAATPIPQNPAELEGLDLFSGKVAKPRPVSAPRVPRHPFMAANGRNAVHNDAYQTDTYRNSGPLGRRTRIFTQSIDGVGGLGSCGITIAFDKRGRLITTCISATTVELRADGQGLDTVASHLLPPRIIPPGVNPLQSPGGAYFYVDNQDRAVVSIGRQIFVVADRGQHPRAGAHLRPQLGRPRATTSSTRRCPTGAGGSGSSPASTASSARSTRPAGACSARHRTNEAIGNSFAMDETGGVFIVTDRAQYRFDAARAASPRSAGACATTTSATKKPGQFDAGSGTTPTLMGKKLPVDRRQRRPHAGGRDAPRQAPAARAAPASSASSRCSAGAPAPPRTRSSRRAAR